MPDRRLVLATLASATLLAGALLVPFGSDAAPEEALEPSSVTGPIASAIDAGAADSFAGLLPTSEQHQRVSAVVNGLKDGIPSPAPSLTSAQLADITAIASGAADGTLAVSPNSLTSSGDKTALRALATGYLSGALDALADAPGQGRAAVDGAVTAGVFTGAVGLLVGDEPALSTSDYEAYGEEIASGAFAELEKDGALLAGAAGSPALGDITLHTTTLVRGQLGSLPAGIARAQLEAVAAFGAGAIDGLVEASITEFPQGAPLASRDDAARWIDTLAHGHEGVPPWTKPPAMPLLRAWAEGLAAGGLEGVHRAREELLSTPTPPSTQAEIEAWADALSQGGFERLDALPSASEALQADVRAYAEAVSGAAVDAILTDSAPSSPELLQAWAGGLAAGVDDLRGASATALGLSEGWLEGLAGAATDLPLDATGPQVAMVRAFAEGATNQLTIRMENITKKTVAEEDSAFVAAMAEAIGAAAVALAGADAFSDPELAEAMGDGIASGFLETRNPQTLFDDIDHVEAAMRAWVANGPPASIGGLNTIAQGSASRAYYAATGFGQVVGGAPVDWAAARGIAVGTEGFGGVEDALWVAQFTPTFVEELLGSMDPGEPAVNVDAIMRYAQDVSAQLPNASLAIGNLTAQDGDLAQHAYAFAAYLAGPAEWLHIDGDAGALEAAIGAAESVLSNATGIERFTDAEYTSAMLAYVDAVALGLLPDRAPNGDHLAPWVQGLLDAPDGIPSEELGGDLTARLEWVTTTVQVVAPLAEDITVTQGTLAYEYAKAAAEWALASEDRVPDMEGLPTPLLVWANATVATALANLPPTPTEEEQTAIVAYLEGIAQAIGSLPDPTEYEWESLPDAAVVDAYLAGITSGVARIPEETHAFMCAATGKSTNETPCSEDEEPEPCEPDCPPPPPPDPEPCEDDCRLAQYADALSNWTASLAGAVDQLDDADLTPTQDGLALVTDWAFQVLGGHGLCKPGDDPETCGPRGPVLEFVRASGERVADANEAVGLGIEPLSEIDPEDPLPADPFESPAFGWAAGTTQGIWDLWRDPRDIIPSVLDGDGDPSAGAPPLGEPSDPAYRQLLYAWALSMFEVPGKLRDDALGPFPDTSGINATIADLDAFFAESIWQGGAYAILDSADEAERYVREPLPDDALDAWALGLATAVQETLIDPTQDDVQSLLFWYAGAAQGGVDAILGAGAAASERQVPVLQAYAQVLAETYAPPPPPELQTVSDITSPSEQGDADEEEAEETPEGEAEEGASEDESVVWLEILQAYAAGMADAVLDHPFQSNVATAEQFHADALFWMDGIVAASQSLPPASPDAGYPARLRAWAQAQTNGATQNPPTTPERVTVDPDLAMAQAFVEGFAGSSAWNLGEDIEGKEAWAESAIAAGVTTECPEGVDPAACASLGATLGDALGQSLPQEAGEIPLPSDAEREAILAAILGSLAPTLPEADGVLSALPYVAVEPALEEMVAFLLAKDPQEIPALAQGAAALVAGMGAQADDPEAVERALASYFDEAAGSGGVATVSVGDGERTRAGAALDGTPTFDGLVPITISVYPRSSAPVQATWELRWSASDPTAAGASRVAMQGKDGAYAAVLEPSVLASLARGAAVRFVLVESAAGRETVHERDGEPFAFVPDRDAPVANVDPGAVTGASVALTWSGDDGDSDVASHRVETRDNNGEWKEWIKATRDTSATFTGAAGHSYAFRVTATDAVGHASPPVETTSIRIPASAPANRAPTLSVAVPAADAVFGTSVPVRIDAADADGTSPMLRVCLRKESASVDLACPYEGSGGDVALDTTGFADGRYRVHAIATDGTLTAEALSPAFRIDRLPPSIRGAAADPSPLALLLSASVDDAVSVVVDAGGRSIALRDDGSGADARAGDGIWTGSAPMPAGEHKLTFRATDANGNHATLAKTVVVPAMPTPDIGGGPTTPTAPTAPPTAAPPTPDAEGGKGTPALGLAGLVAALAACAVLGRRGRDR